MAFAQAVRQMLGQWEAGAKVPNPDPSEWCVCVQMRHKIIRSIPLQEEEAEEIVQRNNTFHGGALKFWKESVRLDHLTG
jgi:hypothetical protein